MTKKHGMGGGEGRTEEYVRKERTGREITYWGGRHMERTKKNVNLFHGEKKNDKLKKERNNGARHDSARQKIGGKKIGRERENEELFQCAVQAISGCRSSQ